MLVGFSKVARFVFFLTTCYRIVKSRILFLQADPYLGFNAVVDKGPLPVRDLQQFGKVF